MMNFKVRKLARPLGWAEFGIFAVVLMATASATKDLIQNSIAPFSLIEHFSEDGKPLTTLAAMGRVKDEGGIYKILPQSDIIRLKTDAASQAEIKDCKEFWSAHQVDVVPIGDSIGTTCYVRVPGSSKSVPGSEAFDVYRAELVSLKADGKMYRIIGPGKKDRSLTYVARPEPREVRNLLLWKFAEPTTYQTSLFAKLDLADCPENPHQDKCRDYLR